jgi:hypothetical protein
MQKMLMTATIIGSALGGYYFAGATEYDRMYAGLQPRDQIAVHGYYESANSESQPDYDVTYDRGVVFIWEPAR